MEKDKANKMQYENNLKEFKEKLINSKINLRIFKKVFSYSKKLENDTKIYHNLKVKNNIDNNIKNKAIQKIYQ